MSVSKNSSLKGNWNAGIRNEIRSLLPVAPFFTGGRRIEDKHIYFLGLVLIPIDFFVCVRRDPDVKIKALEWRRCQKIKRLRSTRRHRLRVGYDYGTRKMS